MEEIKEILAMSNFWIANLIVFVWICAFIGSPKRWKTIVARILALGAAYYALTVGVTYIDFLFPILNTIASYFISWVVVNIIIRVFGWVLASDKDLVDLIMG